MISEVFFAAFAVEFFLGGEDRAAVFDELVDDSGESTGGGGDGLWSAEARFMRRK